MCLCYGYIYSYLFELFCGGNLKNIESEIKNIEITIFVNERMKIISLLFPLVIHLHGQDLSRAIPLVLIQVDNEGRK